MKKRDNEQLFICPKAKTCIEDCDVCKEPHKLKDCMRPAKKDWAITGCHVKCVPIKKRQKKKLKT